ncbi:Inositol 2-dehydrogenase [Planctomycetes bacterium Pan216]|uniref:Inositol 2-dehydrogenase n=1 Tax=Kolteria novifilia TaxID=2527975 RepID=A0A518B9E2_9BACT|nr:Inositol 2-dehydrogenase [Planctomycetes bacterium Pan216]
MKNQTRRRFIKSSAALMAAPAIVPSSVFSKEGQPAPSDKVIVGSIGVGDLGRRHHLKNMLLKNPRIEVAAVCDVDRDHRDLAARDVWETKKKKVGVYEDFREVCERDDIDAVLIATPDHWHALIANYAMQCGKDVFCEKPLTYTIDEGKKLVQTARRYGSVFQTGSQQRSDKRFRLACELVRNGKIGKLKQVDTIIGGINPGSWQKPATPPSALNWDFWLGPAPYVDYAPNRVHYQFRWFSSYSGGKMTDWGAHHNDIAQWGIGADGSGPLKVKGKGERHPNGPHDVFFNFDVEYDYPDGVKMFCHSGPIELNGVKIDNGVMFTGSDGWVFVKRGKIEASNPELLKTEFSSGDERLYLSNHHHNNWLDCIASRERAICDVEVGHRSCTVCHLGNIAMILGRELTWNPEKEEFENDAQANLLLRRPMRSPWTM